MNRGEIVILCLNCLSMVITRAYWPDCEENIKLIWLVWCETHRQWLCGRYGVKLALCGWNFYVWNKV